jgi:ABC-type transport system involved in multi-copper enzyme maturation permease subunit
MGREIRSVLPRTLGYLLVLEALLVAAILFWPKFEENLDAFLEMAPNQVLGGFVTAIARGGVIAYVNLQHFFKGCNTLGAAAAVLFASGAVAGEAHRGTLEIWLSRPLSRRRILLERFAIGALAVVIPVFLTSLTVPALLARVHEETRLVPLLLCSAHQSLFLLAIYSATFFFSSVGRSPARIAFGMLLFTILEFAIYLVMEATHASIFRLVDIQVLARIWTTGRLDPGICVPLAVFSALALAASLFAFERRVP